MGNVAGTWIIHICTDYGISACLYCHMSLPKIGEKSLWNKTFTWKTTPPPPPPSIYFDLYGAQKRTKYRLSDGSKIQLSTLVSLKKEPLTFTAVNELNKTIHYPFSLFHKTTCDILWHFFLFKSFFFQPNVQNPKIFGDKYVRIWEPGTRGLWYSSFRLQLINY